MALPFIDGDILDQQWRTSGSLDPHSLALKASQWGASGPPAVGLSEQAINGKATTSIRAYFTSAGGGISTSGTTNRPSLIRFAPIPAWALESNRFKFPVSPGDEVDISAGLSYSGNYEAIQDGVKGRFVIQFMKPDETYLTQAESSVAPRSISSAPEELRLTQVVPSGAASAELLFTMISTTVPVTISNFALYLTDPKIVVSRPTKSGVADVSASTDARLGIVSDIYSRSREKIQLKLAGVDDLVRSGHRIELAAAAMTSTPAVWHWRQVTGPTVALNVRENTCDFIAPDVERSTRIRIGVYAASEDGGNRSDWHYFDLDVEPPMLRFRGGDDGDFSPRSPYLVGYSRGKREIWNDVIRPATYEKNPRHELEVVDLGVPDDDVVFSTETPRRMAAGGVWVNPETGDVFRNFGAGYNETDDTTASPRTSTYWVNPANGDILEWIED